MAVIIWPLELPQRFLRDGYSEKLPDGRVMSSPDTGPPKTRRRSKASRLIQARIWLDTSMVARLDRFWEEETDGGRLSFVIPDQYSDGLPILTDASVGWLTSEGVPILIASNYLVLFAQQGAPDVINVGGAQFTASFSLIVLP